MQLWDILRSIDYLVEEQKLKLSSISVYGRKDMGVLAIYAGALDNRITRVIVEDPAPSHWQGPAFLNVLRHTDIAEVAGLLADREIVSLTPLPATFQLTERVFKLHGKPGQIRQARALGDALRVWQY
jgi:hypothetical protein